MTSVSIMCAWPSYSEAALEEEQLLIVVQVNGKVRGKMTVPAEITQERIEASAMADARVMSFCDGRKYQAGGLRAAPFSQHRGGGVSHVKNAKSVGSAIA